MNNKVQHFVRADPFLRPSVVEQQFRIPYLVSGDSSDLRFPLVADASDVDVIQSVFVSSENAVFTAQVHMQILRDRDGWRLELEGPHRICRNISKNLPGTVTQDLP
jgi:hypothetical protein